MRFCSLLRLAGMDPKMEADRRSSTRLGDEGEGSSGGRRWGERVESGRKRGNEGGRGRERETGEGERERDQIEGEGRRW